MKTQSDVMRDVIQIELRQNNPNKERRLAKFKEVLERERKLECRELAKTILYNYPGIMSMTDVERREIILRYSVFARLPESTGHSDTFRLLFEGWMKARYELAQVTMKKYGWQNLPFDERDTTLKVLLQEGPREYE